MINKRSLEVWTVEALTALGGSAHDVRIAEYIWNHHKEELEQAGDLFFTWQYDLRWAATSLRTQGKLSSADGSRNTGIWTLL